jgi:hypothetical protein
MLEKYGERWVKVVNDTCFNGLSEAERITQKIKRLRSEKECFEVAKEIYKYIEAHPSCALVGKRITITPCFEAKQSRREK